MLPRRGGRRRQPSYSSARAPFSCLAAGCRQDFLLPLPHCAASGRRRATRHRRRGRRSEDRGSTGDRDSRLRGRHGRAMDRSGGSVLLCGINRPGRADASSRRRYGAARKGSGCRFRHRRYDRLYRGLRSRAEGLQDRRRTAGPDRRHPEARRAGGCPAVARHLSNHPHPSLAQGPAQGPVGARYCARNEHSPTTSGRRSGSRSCSTG